MNDPQHSMVVEFLGLPGAGKTTVSKRIAEHLSQWGITIREPVRDLSDRSGLSSSLRGYHGKSSLVAQELIAHPAASWRSLRVLLASGQPSLRVLFKVSFNWLMQCSLLRSCRSTRVVHLFDEGIFQGLWSIGLEGREGVIREVGAALHETLSRPDVVVVLDAEPAVIAQRLRDRGGRDSRADRDWLDDHDAVVRAASLMREVVDALEAVSGRDGMPQVFHVDNGSPLDAEATAWNIACAIERQWLAQHGVAAVPARARGPAPRPGGGASPARKLPHLQMEPKRD